MEYSYTHTHTQLSFHSYSSSSQSPTAIQIEFGMDLYIYWGLALVGHRADAINRQISTHSTRFSVGAKTEYAAKRFIIQLE